MRALIRVSCSAVAFAVVVAAQTQPATPRQGRPVQVPEGSTSLRQVYGFLASAPVAKVVAPGRLEVVIETLTPTPPATLYLGLNSLDEDLDWPRYRQSVREVGAITELRTTHRIAAEFATLLARMPNTAYEPRVVWRAEIWVPELGSSRFAEGRVYFDPKTGGDAMNITIGPFVDLVTASEATIWWECDRDSDGEVRIGERVFASGKPGRRHEVRVTGLAPATRHEYRVASGGTVVRPYAFRTAADGAFTFAAMVDCREGVGGGLRNYAGVQAEALRALTTLALRNDAAFVLFAGDLTNGYTTSVTDFELLLDAFRRATSPVHARIPFYMGMGNHESLVDAWRTPHGRVFYADKGGDDGAEAVFGRTFVTPRNGPADEGAGTPGYAGNVYRFDHGAVRVFVLNNNYWWCSDPHRFGGNLEGFVMAKQMEWLRAEVAAADADPAIAHLFFAAQEPPFPNGGHTIDAMWYRSKKPGEGGDTDRDGDVDASDVDIVGNRNEMWEIVASSEKSVAFICGDEHAYSRVLIRPETPIGKRAKSDGKDARFAHAVWQVTSGGAGAPWYDKELDLPWSGELAAHSTLPHCALFRVDGARVALEVLSETGQVLDSVNLR